MGEKIQTVEQFIDKIGGEVEMVLKWEKSSDQLIRTAKIDHLFDIGFVSVKKNIIKNAQENWGQWIISK